MFRSYLWSVGHLSYDEFNASQIRYILLKRSKIIIDAHTIPKYRSLKTHNKNIIISRMVLGKTYTTHISYDSLRNTKYLQVIERVSTHDLNILRDFEQRPLYTQAGRGLINILCLRFLPNTGSPHPPLVQITLHV